MSRPAVGRGRVLGGAGVARPGRLALSRARVFCCADTDGLLTAERVIEGVSPQAVHWVYMCRPQPVRKPWSDGLSGNRWPDRGLRWE